MRVAVVGGGIGGLCTAHALKHHGIEAIVLERASELSEVGAGIQIASNGALVLRELGLETALDRVATKPDGFAYRDLATGRSMYFAPLGPEAEMRYGAPMYNVHRADLIGLLAEGLPKEWLRLGAQCASIGQEEGRAFVKLASGETIEADAVIGADGIHSMVRQALRGPEQAQFANILMWRSLIPASRLKGLDLPVRGNNWFGPGRTIISYWVRPDLYSVLASVPATEVRRESWTTTGDVAELLASFREAEPTVQRMLEAAETAFLTGMYYRDPIDKWSDGRITLLGDGAHAMVPFLAQGACQSIEDAWTLAVCLHKHGREQVPDALQEYEQRRLPRTTRVQAGARAIVKLVHEGEPEAIRHRNARWKGMARIDPLAETSWGFVWDYNILEAVKEPAGNVEGLSSVREGVRMQRAESQRAFDLWKNAFAPEDVARGYHGLREAYERFLQASFPAPPELQVTEAELGGVRALRVDGCGALDAGTPVLLHFHGGAYVLGSAQGSVEYAGRLSSVLGGPCYTVDYRLAPEHPYPAAIDDALDAYRGLLASGVPSSSILVSGESSGGGLAIALALAARQAGLPLPAGVIAICPFTDLTLQGPTIRLHAGNDPAANRDLLSFLASSYFQGHEPTDPLVSPLFGKLEGLPPLFVAAAEGEVLRSDSTRLVAKAKDAGVPVRFESVPDSVHVFTLFPFLSETRRVLQTLGHWAREVMSAEATAGEA
jgi:salicylate hydroxylase